MTLFGAQLNEITEVEKGKIASTDSRLRPDQIALEKGDHQTAEHLKNELEEAAAKKKEEAKKKADALRNANDRAATEEVATVEFAVDQVQRGKARYGSN